MTETPIEPYPGDPDWPTEWQGSRLTGRYVDTLGAPVKGSVLIKPSPGAIIATASRTIIIAATRTVTLDANGEMDVIVPATDDPDVNPTGWTYLITENFPGGRSYSITAPTNAEQDLSAIVPVPAANGASITRGISAYEAAVANGFVGTEQEWLDSLVGPEGPQGPEGPAGSGGGLDAEGVRDTMGAALVGVGAVTVTPDDAADTITVATTATVNDTDANLRDRATHTGTQDLDTTTDTATRLAMTPEERSKVAGVAPSATANSSDAELRDRATHTGTQDLDTTTDSATRLALTPAERSKVAGVADGATANDTDVALRDRATHTGTQDLDTTTDSATRLALTPAERSKVAGVADGATANSSDAQLRDRATHTGVQSSASISDFAEAVQDALAVFFNATGATFTYDDVNDQMVVDVPSGGGGSTDAEIVRDTIGAALVGLGNIGIAVDDAGDTITISTTATVNSTDAALRDRQTHTGTQDLDTTTDTATRLAMTPAERSKVAGVDAGATANASDAQLRDRATHTGTQDLDTTTDSGTRLAMTPAERTKLGGVATSATANDTDANLRDRATHTGEQAIATVTGLQAELDGKAADSHAHTAADVGAMPLTEVVATEPVVGDNTVGYLGDWTVGYVTGGTSPTIFSISYQPDATRYRTFWFNENGSPRAAMGKAGDPALRVIGFGAGQTDNTFEVQRFSGAGTGGRNNDFAIGPDGMPRIGNNDVPAALCVVIASGETAPPAGTPAGTVVVRLRP